MSAAADKAAAGRKSRNKGRDGEQEIARLVRDLTGWDVKRRVRQREGESDLTGVPGWSVEVKRYARISRALLRGWWAQAAAQRVRGEEVPVLFFRQDRDEWRAVWPGGTGDFTDYAHTVEGSVEAWAGSARELAAEMAAEGQRSTLLEQNTGPSAAEIAQEAA